MVAIPQHDTIEDLQFDLYQCGYYRAKIDGVFGPLTLAALMQSRADTPRWLRIAAGELGVSEIVGRRHNPRILEYHQYTDLKAAEDEVPWCSSFVNWVFGVLGMKGTNSAAARSWLKWGVEREAFGCVYVMTRGSNPHQGHVGFLLARVGQSYAVLGGNQGDKVSVATFATRRALGYRMPEF